MSEKGMDEPLEGVPKTRVYVVAAAEKNVYVLAPAAKVRISLFEAITGYTDAAVRRKIAEGKWLQGREYERAPDGNLLIIMEGFYKWAAGEREPV